MLVIDREEDWLAIGQPAHAWLSGQVARAWGNGRFAAPDPFEDVCLGIEQHDIGWIDWDLRPPLLASARRAAGVFEAPFAPRLQLWARAPERLLTASPWAALLVSLHGRNIHTRFGDPERLPEPERGDVLAYLARQAALQDRLIGALGIDRAAAERAGDLLFCLDTVSLTVCHGWPARDLPPVEGVAIRMEPGGEAAFTLDPWPLGVPQLEVGLHARRLTERFDDEAALHRALATTPWTALRWTLRPRRG